MKEIACYIFAAGMLALPVSRLFPANQLTSPSASLSPLSLPAANDRPETAPPGPASPPEAAADTLTAQVSEWQQLKPHIEKEGVSRQVLKGSTHDLTVLDIRAITLEPGRSSASSPKPAETDELIIIKDGTVTATTTHASKTLGPGGVALLASGEKIGFSNTGTSPATYYLFRFKTSGPENRTRGAMKEGPLLIDWKEMTMKKTDKGESRQIFDRPLSWLGRIDMHATTLNAGEVSHPPHIHRAEEIILMRSGNVQMYIDGKHHKATDGDLVFLSSGIPHALENKEGTTRAEYFALQWAQ